MKTFFAWIARRRFNYFDGIGFIFFGSFHANGHLLMAFVALIGMALLSSVIESISQAMGNSAP